MMSSLSPATDETGEEKALQTWANLISYIRILGDDCLATGQNT